MLVTLHAQRYDPWQNTFARDVGAGFVKIVNPPERGGLFPDVPRVLGRIHTDAIDAGYIREGREGGARFVRDMLPRWRATPEVTAWELCNEPDVASNDGLAALNNYTIGAIEEAERYGVRLCILNCSEGNPSGDAAAIRWKWEQLLPCIKRAVQGGHWVGLHAYWRPGIEGPTGRYHALGRRRYDIEVLAALGVDTSRLKVLINETGIDGGIAGGPPATGWRILSDVTAYRAEIVEAERFARAVPQIEALMLFTSGWEKPWQSYDVDEAFARSLVDPLRALGSTIPIEEEPMNSYEIDAARQRLAILPATMKACDLRGYVFRQEWGGADAVYCLAWKPTPGEYRCLKLESRTWLVVEDVRVWPLAQGGGSPGAVASE